MSDEDKAAAPYATASTTERSTATMICAVASTVTKCLLLGTDRLCCMEIKHGHICKLAFSGQIIVSGGFHLRGNVAK